MSRRTLSGKSGCVSLIILALFMAGCTQYSARQSTSERTLLKAPLAEGEMILRANSCSRVPRATFIGGGSAVFGSCYLTNLRLIYEESEWAKNLAVVGKALPTNGDFGMSDLLKGAYSLINAHYVIEMGNNGKLNVVERTGQVIIPLSEIQSMSLSGSRFSSDVPANPQDARWLTLNTREGFQFILEIYDRPPDKTGWMPGFQSALWKNEIEQTRLKSFK